MKKKILLIPLVLLLSMTSLLVACAESEPAPAPAVGPVPKIIRIGSAPAVRLRGQEAVAINTVLRKYSHFMPKHMDIGEIAWLPLLGRGEMEYAVTGQTNMVFAFPGIGPYSAEKGGEGAYPNVRNVIGGGYLFDVYFVRKDSDMYTTADLKGKRIGWGFPAAWFFDYETRAMLANAGLSEDDIIKVPAASIGTTHELFREGRIDAFIASPATPKTIEMEAAFGIRALTADPSPEAVAACEEVFPGMTVAPYYDWFIGTPGIPEQGYNFSWTDLLVTTTRQLEEDVYLVTKILYENMEEVAAQNPTSQSWSQDMAVLPKTRIPYHPGAIKYYKEIGIWTAEMVKVQADLLAKAEEITATVPLAPGVE